MIIIVSLNPKHESKVEGIMKEIKQAYPDEITKIKAISKKANKEVDTWDTKNCYNRLTLGTHRGEPFCEAYSMAACKCFLY